MKLYNSLSNKIESFQPIDSFNVKMYVCGITPYDTTHLGHAFVYVTFDAFKRFLEFKGYNVTYTQNVTDIDDDILKRAKRDRRDWKELGDFWTEKFLVDMKALNVKMPDLYVKATESMDEIIGMTAVLIKKGFAYISNGNVYFGAVKFPDYGKLSKFSPEKMLVLLKERGGNPDDPNKKAPLDFILWQKSTHDEPYWDSPFSKGRPGWHIECSAMIKKTLGEQIDIHGGGMDLIYPHHESELAQSESYSGKKPFVKYWMHIEMVEYTGEKMSKSLGNLVLVSDLFSNQNTPQLAGRMNGSQKNLPEGILRSLPRSSSLKKYSPNAIRLMLLLNHYRKPWEYKEELMQKAQETMGKLEIKFRHTPLRWEAKLKELNDLLLDLEDDFNTGKTLNKLIEVSDTNPALSKEGFKLLGFNLG